MRRLSPDGLRRVKPMDPIKYRERRDAQKQAEADGKVADSMDVRKALMEKVHSGEISLEEAQKQLAAIKRNGQITRNQAFTGRY